jgi:hypothetical protein
LFISDGWIPSQPATAVWDSVFTVGSLLAAQSILFVQSLLGTATIFADGTARSDHPLTQVVLTSTLPQVMVVLKLKTVFN